MAIIWTETGAKKKGGEQWQAYLKWVYLAESYYVTIRVYTALRSALLRFEARILRKRFLYLSCSTQMSSFCNVYMELTLQTVREILTLR